MKARDIVGKRVARIDQQRVRNNYGKWVHHIHRIVFDDGSALRLDLSELEDSDPAIYGVFIPKDNS